MRNMMVMAMAVGAAAAVGLAAAESPAGSAVVDTSGKKEDVAMREPIKQKNEWVGRNLLDEKSNPPFSFTYGGKPSADLLSAWERKVVETKLDEARTERVLTWTDPATGLAVRCRVVEYRDFPVVEWTTWFRNAGKVETPILADIQGLDVAFTSQATEPFVLRTIRGDNNSAASYTPGEFKLKAGASQRLASVGGRPTDGNFPYFNIAWDGGGVVAVLGWPGQWAARFDCNQQRDLRMVGGQEQTRLKLLPGEEVRAPLALLMFWHGDDVVDAQNQWRRFYMRHVIPHPAGKPMPPLAQIQVGGTSGGKALFDLTKAHQDLGIKPDLCWLDAGWYPCGGNWWNTGTWELDTNRFPRGFKPFADAIHAQGIKFILWFEPERIGKKDNWLASQHPDWLLGGTLLNLGNPAAHAWAVEHFDAMIKAQGVDFYRQDFNIAPLNYWRSNDRPDRQGITENLYVQGYLAYWDELQKRNPGLMIDSCAAGGRRNDLETMRRAVPLLRSDYQMPTQPNVVEANQCQTYGLSSWLPYQGTGSYSGEPYWARSFYLAGYGFGPDAGGAKAYAECRRIAPCMLADYYPLTPFAEGKDLAAWMGWQFNRPEQGDGVIQVFHRAKCEGASLTVHLRGLDPAAEYELTNFDVAGTNRVSGRTLMEKGLMIEITAKPGAAVIAYTKVAL